MDEVPDLISGLKAVRKERGEKPTPMEQVYIFNDMVNKRFVGWDVTVADQILREKPRPARGIVRVAEWWLATGIRSHIEKEYAMTTDLSKPAISVPYGEPGCCVTIDGTHRLYKAYLLNRREHPTFLLTQEEADRARIPDSEALKIAMSDGV